MKSLVRVALVILLALGLQMLTGAAATAKYGPQASASSPLRTTLYPPGQSATGVTENLSLTFSLTTLVVLGCIFFILGVALCLRPIYEQIGKSQNRLVRMKSRSHRSWRRRSVAGIRQWSTTIPCPVATPLRC